MLNTITHCATLQAAWSYNGRWSKFPPWNIDGISNACGCNMSTLTAVHYLRCWSGWSLATTPLLTSSVEKLVFSPCTLSVPNFFFFPNRRLKGWNLPCRRLSVGRIEPTTNPYLSCYPAITPLCNRYNANGDDSIWMSWKKTFWKTNKQTNSKWEEWKSMP